MEGGLFEYVWRCGELSGYQYLQCVSMNAYKSRWYIFRDIQTDEKVVVHRDQYPSFRWLNDGHECFHTFKMIFYGNKTNEGHSFESEEEPERD